MKKQLAVTAGILLGLLGAVGTAAAQYGADADKADRRFYLSPQASYSLFDKDRGFEDEIGYQLAIGKILGRGTNIELHGSFVEPGPEDEGINGGELTGYGVTVLLFQARQDFPLYGILSVSKGFAQADGGAEESPDEAESDQFDAGLGYLLPLGRWPLIGQGAGLRIEARYRTDKFSQSEAQKYAEQFGHEPDRTFHDGVFSVGLLVPLGADPNRPEPVEEEPEEPDTSVVRAVSDSDGDGIPDESDQCPGTPEGARINARGCEIDSDNDGVGDSRDACPGTPSGQEVADDGCPPDGDDDGVADSADQCPNTPSGSVVLADGCALKGDCRVPSPGQRIDADGCAVGAVVLKGVQFEVASAALTTEAKQVLDGVAKALRGTTGVRIEIGGHTDATGSEAANRKLSELRALAVKRYLVSNGVKSEILTVKGYGESQPLVSNDTAEGRATNRRVELRALDD